VPDGGGITLGRTVEFGVVGGFRRVVSGRGAVAKRVGDASRLAAGSPVVVSGVVEGSRVVDRPPIDGVSPVVEGSPAVAGSPDEPIELDDELPYGVVGPGIVADGTNESGVVGVAVAPVEPVVTGWVAGGVAALPPWPQAASSPKATTTAARPP
jgi:hypothetical protein